MSRIFLSLTLSILIVSCYSLSYKAKPLLASQDSEVSLAQSQQDSASILLDSIGHGYNLFTGDLHESNDQGVSKKPIFELTIGSKRTSDGKFKLPREADEVNSRVALQPDYRFISGIMDYNVYLNTTFTVNGGPSNFKNYWLNQAPKYSQIIKTLSEDKIAIYMAKLKCSVYSVAMKKVQKFSKDFLDDLSSAYKNDDWDSFVKSWGVYYITHVTFGAIAQQKVTYPRTTASDLLIANVLQNNIYPVFMENFTPIDYPEILSKVDSKAKFILENYGYNTSNTYLGAAPSSSKKLEDWVSEIRSNPAPIGYQLLYIGDLFSTRYLGGYFDENTLATMRSAFEASVTRMYIDGKDSNTKFVFNDISRSLESHSIVVGGSNGKTFTESSAYSTLIKPVEINLTYDPSKIYSIQILVSDGRPTFTAQYKGNQSMGTKASIPIPWGKRVEKVNVRYQPGGCITGLQFFIQDVGPTAIFGASSGGEMETVPINGYLYGTKGATSDCIVSIGFVSKVFVYSYEETTTFATQAFGGSKGKLFYWIFNSHSNPDRIEIRNDSSVNSIQLFFNKTSSERFGGDSGKLNSINYTDICGFRAMVSTKIERLDVCQSLTKWTSFGGDAGTIVGFDVPKGDYKLIGVYGRASDEIERLGFIYSVK